MQSIGKRVKGLQLGLVLLIVASLAPMTWASASDANGSSSAADKAAADTQAQQRQKIEKLSNHIARAYQVRPAKANLVVTEVMRHAEQHNLEPELVLAVIATESTFRAKAVSRAGARGLMQVVPKWHRQKIKAVGGNRALFDPAKNIQVGTQILSEYIAMSRGNVRRGLLRYNGSLGKRSRYANRVLRHYNRLKKVA